MIRDNANNKKSILKSNHALVQELRRFCGTGQTKTGLPCNKCLSWRTSLLCIAVKFAGREIFGGLAYEGLFGGLNGIIHVITYCMNCKKSNNKNYILTV